MEVRSAPGAAAAERAAKKPALAPDAEEVRKLVEDAVNTVLEVFKEAGTGREDKRKKVMDVVDPLFDFHLMSKLVLGRKNLRKFDKAQRKEFSGLFTEQLKGSYFDKVELLTDERVEFEDPVRKVKGKKRKKTHFHVLTYIVSKGERYGMLYKLYKRGSSWQVYDVEIEGISLVKSYGAQYSRFLRKGSVPDLIKRMRERSLDEPEDLKGEEEETGVAKPEAGG